MKLLVACLSTQLLIVAPAFAAANQQGCEALTNYVTGLTDETLHQPFTNITAKWIAAAGDAPTYCEIKARIFPQTDFVVRLPAEWQGRYIHQGGGAWDGSLYTGLKQYATLGHVLALGYVNSSSNGGHDGSQYPSPGAFALKDPYFQQMLFPNDPNKSNPNSCQMLVDFGNRAQREVPLATRKIIQQFYGQQPHHTYYWGSSTGGREGLVSAQKNHDIFDGFFIGWPTGGHVAVNFRGAWDTYWGQTSGLSKGAIPYSQKSLAHRNAVYGKCDGIDGLVDGLIDDPRQCKFDPVKDLPACANDVDAPACFTAAQRTALGQIYRGPNNSSGQLYIGQQLSGEYLTNPTNGASTGFNAALDDGLSYDYSRYITFDPPAGPNWDPKTLDFEVVPNLVKNGTCTQCYGGDCKTYKLTDELDAVTLTPDLKPNMGGYSPLKKKGGKIIMETGFADALVSALTTTTLYDSVLKEMGTAQTRSFWKLYMAAGMSHGGPGVGGEAQFDDYMPKLINWVENGVEPTTLTQVRAATTSLPAQTRPLCQYPEVARYHGASDARGTPLDDIHVAANFSCVPPITVNVDPDSINLGGGKGRVVARVTVPDGFRLVDWNIGDLTLQGARAVNGTIEGNTYVAHFQKSDMQDLAPGAEVNLTLKGAFAVDGKQVRIQGSDTVRVK